MIYNDIITRGIEMERIMNISKWTKEDIIRALERRGYSDDGIVSAKFAGVNDSHQAMFIIAIDDGNDYIDYGKVFVYIDAGGELVADY